MPSMSFIAPIIEGGDHANTPAPGLGSRAMSDAHAAGDQLEVTQVAGDLRIRGCLSQPWRMLAGFPDG